MSIVAGISVGTEDGKSRCMYTINLTVEGDDDAIEDFEKTLSGLMQSLSESQPKGFLVSYGMSVNKAPAQPPLLPAA
jgi:hypothetical protein